MARRAAEPIELVGGALVDGAPAQLGAEPRRERCQRGAMLRARTPPARATTSPMKPYVPSGFVERHREVALALGTRLVDAGAISVALATRRSAAALRRARPRERVPGVRAARGASGRVAADRDHAAIDAETRGDLVGGALERLIELTAEHRDPEHAFELDRVRVAWHPVPRERAMKRRFGDEDVRAGWDLLRDVARYHDDERVDSSLADPAQRFGNAGMVGVEHDCARRRRKCGADLVGGADDPA